VNGRALAAILLLTCLAPACDEKPETPAPDTAPPQVWITSPADSATIAGADSIRIAATDDEGVMRVAAYLDTDSLGEDLTAPYAIAFDPTRVAADTFALSARAWDAAGNRGESAPQTLFVLTPDLGPQVSITAPADSSEAVSPALIWIEIATTATELDSVRVFVDGVLLGDDDEPPFHVLWNSQLWADGAAHALTAEGQDIAGLVGPQSPAVTIFVYPRALAAPILIAPPDDAPCDQGDPVELVWSDDSFASRFQLQVADSDDFGEPALDIAVADTTLVLSAPIAGDNFWRLRGWRPGRDWGPWSEVRRFVHTPVFDGELLLLDEPSTGRAIAERPGGGLLLAGSLGDELLLLALDAAGDPDWVQLELQDLACARAARLAPRPAGGCFVLGSGFIPGAGGAGEVVCLDIDEAGTVLDRRSIDLESPEPVGLLPAGGMDVVILSNGFYMLSCFHLARLGAAGNVAWQAAVGTCDELNSSSGMAYWARGLLRGAGDEIVTPWRNHDYWDNYITSQVIGCTGRDPASGEPLWSLSLASSSSEDPDPHQLQIGPAILDEDGSILCLGWVDDDAVLWRIAADHASAQAYPIAGLATATFAELGRLADGDLVAVGTRREGLHYNDAVAACITPVGQLVWERVLGAAGVSDSFAGVRVIEGDQIAAIGTWAAGSNPPAGHLWLKRFDANGNDIMQREGP
jgi:hypothetical protein